MLATCFDTLSKMGLAAPAPFAISTDVSFRAPAGRLARVTVFQH
jgi:hypothetical protein